MPIWGNEECCVHSDSDVAALGQPAAERLAWLWATPASCHPPGKELTCPSALLPFHFWVPSDQPWQRRGFPGEGRNCQSK